jgi:hypothetical protein
MKRGKGITINLSNKVAYTLIAIFILAVIGGVVFAYNSNPADPAVFGHSADEIDGLDGIVGGEITLTGCYWKSIYLCNKGAHPESLCGSNEVMTGFDSFYDGGNCYGFIIDRVRCCKLSF